MAKSNTNVVKLPVFAAITAKVAVASFRDYASRWQGASVGLVASCAVCLIVCLRSKAKVDYSTTVLKLRAEVAENGLKEAMIFKYVGLGRALAEHVDKLDADEKGNPIMTVLRATNPDKAVEALVAWAQSHGVTSLDTLGVLVGKYRRSPTPEEAAQTTGTREQGRPADVAALPGNLVMPTKATAQAIGLRIEKEPEVLNAVPIVNLVGAYLKAGHSACEVVEAAVPFIRTLREAKKALRTVQAKIEQIEARPKSAAA